MLSAASETSGSHHRSASHWRDMRYAPKSGWFLGKVFITDEMDRRHCLATAVEYSESHGTFVAMPVPGISGPTQPIVYPVAWMPLPDMR